MPSSLPGLSPEAAPIGIREVRAGGEAEIKGHVGDRTIGLAQRLASNLQSSLELKLLRGLAEIPVENINQAGNRKPAPGRDFTESVRAAKR
jgi:hypothetical protein